MQYSRPLLSPEDAKAPRPRLGLKKSRKFKRQLRVTWFVDIDLVGVACSLGFPQRAIQKRPKPNLPAVLLIIHIEDMQMYLRYANVCFVTLVYLNAISSCHISFETIEQESLNCPY
jgi:hypothetical protein